jgi:leucine dehydrogenase
MNTYTELQISGYERVIEISNRTAGLQAWIALHSTRLGPALGGCRMWNYPSREHAIDDVLRLGKAMTYKNALAGLDFGGGKATIWGAPETKTEALLEAMGAAVEHLGGTYITAEDVGMTFDDMKILRRKTRYIPSLNAGDPAPVTARGVFTGIQSVCRHLGIDDISTMRIAVQGVGCVGYVLTGLLAKAGCQVVVSDINNKVVERVVREYGVTAVAPEKIYEVECDIFSPCALGGIINAATIDKLAKVKAIAGSANNQLAEDELAETLRQMGIIYAPDFAINAGGVILLAGETPGGFDMEMVESRLHAIAPTLTHIFQASEKEAKSTVQIANELAEQRLNQ